MVTGYPRPCCPTCTPNSQMQMALKILPRCSETSNVLSNTSYVVQRKKQIEGSLFFLFICYIYRKVGGKIAE